MNNEVQIDSLTQPQPPATPSFAMLRTLGGIAMLSGLLVVMVVQWTTPAIEENQRIAIEKAVFQVVEGAVSRQDFLINADGAHAPDSGVEGTKLYVGYNEQGEVQGMAMEAAAPGYQDVIKMLFGYDPRCECITGIKVLKMTETPGLGDKIITDAAFLKNFEALEAKLNADRDALANPIVTVKHGTKTQAWQIDAISGATVSSNAVGKALNQAAQKMLPMVQKYLAEFAKGEG